MEKRYESEGLVNTLTIQNINIDQITTDGQMVREGMDPDHIIELASSIARHGLMQPIVVEFLPDGYQLVAGAHRLAAVKRLGWRTIPANVQIEGIKDSIKGRALVENIIRRDLSLNEECDAVAELYNVEKLSTNQICDLLGRSRQWVETRLELPRLPQEVRESLFRGEVSIAAARLIGSVRETGIQLQILNSTVFQRLPERDVRALVELAKEVPSMADAIEAGVKSFQEVASPGKTGRPCEACGFWHDYTKLRVCWICSDGCRPPATEPEGVQNAN